MTSQAEHRGSFPAIEQADWEAVVLKTLRGKSLDSLLATTADGLSIKPLYQAATGEDASEPGAFPFTRSSSAGPRLPLLRQEYRIVSDAERVIAELEGGVSSIQLAANDAEPDAHQLATFFADVLVDLVPICVTHNEQPQNWADALLRLFDEKKPAENPRVHLLQDPVGQLVSAGQTSDTPQASVNQLGALAARVHNDFSTSSGAACVDVARYHDAGATEAQTLAAMLASGKLYLQAMLDHGLSIEQAAAQIQISIAADTDHFMSIAKIRAARTIWAELLAHCGVPQAQCNAELVCVSSQRMLTRYDPWSSLLRTTIAASAGLIAGADTLLIRPFDAATNGNQENRRLTQRLINILTEECRLHEVVDPLGGSGFIEDATQGLCDKAWSGFQDIERAGGILSVVQTGQFQQQIIENRETLRKDIATRKKTLIGVNRFANVLEETTSTRQWDDKEATGSSTGVASATSEQTAALPPFRLAEDYERLRDAVAAHERKNGTVPLQLICIGQYQHYLPKAQFTADVLASAGVQVTIPEIELGQSLTIEPQLEGDAPTDKHCAIVCIGCDDKVEKNMLVSTTTERLREHGFSAIYVTAKPADSLDSPPKVDGYLFEGANTLELLNDIISKLGVTQ